ncbi:MAG: hypothetical protein U0T56_12945 [Ferruginibacter sp.]
MVKTDDIAGKSCIVNRVLRLMGNRFEISIVSDDGESEEAQAKIDLAVTEIQRIERLLTTYDSGKARPTRSTGWLASLR